MIKSEKKKKKTYHHGKNYCSSRSFYHPQEDQTGELDDCEDVDLPEGHVAEVNQVGLVLSGHSK